MKARSVLPIIWGLLAVPASSKAELGLTFQIDAEKLKDLPVTGVEATVWEIAGTLLFWKDKETVEESTTKFIRELLEENAPWLFEVKDKLELRVKVKAVTALRADTASPGADSTRETYYLSYELRRGGDRLGTVIQQPLDLEQYARITPNMLEEELKNKLREKLVRPEDLYKRMVEEKVVFAKQFDVVTQAEREKDWIFMLPLKSATFKRPGTEYTVSYERVKRKELATHEFSLPCTVSTLSDKEVQLLTAFDFDYRGYTRTKTNAKEESALTLRRILREFKPETTTDGRRYPFRSRTDQSLYTHKPGVQLKKLILEPDPSETQPTTIRDMVRLTKR